MTSSKTMIKAVSDGTDTDTSDTDTGPQRPHGIIRAREDQVYYTTGLVGSGLYEAEQLVRTIQNMASAMRIPCDSNAVSRLDMTHVLAVIGEALDCIDLAGEALSTLSTDIRLRQHDEGP
jgi:hypothetical protein